MHLKQATQSLARRVDPAGILRFERQLELADRFGHLLAGFAIELHVQALGTRKQGSTSRRSRG